MADPRFFRNSGPHALSRIVELTGALLPSGIDAARLVQDVAPLESAGPEHISFLDNVKYIPAFEQSRAGACFVREKFISRAPKGMVLLVTENPYLAFAKTAALFYPAERKEAWISPAAHVDSAARIGEGTRIEPGAVIEAGAEIGARCHIGPNVVIGERVKIGDDCNIGACSVITHALIGHRVAIYRGVHIGQDGFGFAPAPDGIFKVPQLGRVLIGNDVEIGAGTCIDRGAGPDTVIGDGTKIDNLAQIGHNCRIGRYAIVVAQVGIAGSSEIGDGAMLGGQSAVAGHVTIGAGAKIAARGAVMRNVPAGETQSGMPAVPIKDWYRQTAAIIRLGKVKGKNDE